MNNKANDIIYNAKDIEQYFSGKLTPLQMHAMEKAALDDAFLAEAMEGFESMKADEWNNELTALKNEFIQKDSQAKVIALPSRKNNWWKIAAAVLLLVSTATISYLFINKKESPEIAQKTQPVNTVADSNISQLKSTTAETATATVTPSTKPDTKEKAVTTIADKDLAAVTEPVKAEYKSIAAEDKSINNPAKQPELKAVKKAKTGDQDLFAKRSKTDDAVADVVPPATAANAAEKYNAKAVAPVPTLADQEKSVAADRKAEAVLSKKDQPAFRSFNAQVLGADNTPLPFANVSIRSENFGTYADVKGNFRLVSADSLLVVEVKATGYQSRFYTLQSFGQQNKIILAEEDAASKYKAVVGASTTARNRISRRATLVKDSLINVEPADGWDNYNTYVDNNIEIPDDILKKEIHGQVELSFDVTSKGNITNIKVDKSLCDNCDEVAKRLIEQGPQWKVKKGKKGKGKVTVQF